MEWRAPSYTGCKTLSAILIFDIVSCLGVMTISSTMDFISSQLIEAPLLSACCIAASLGVTFHQATVKMEFDLHQWLLIASYIAGYISLAWYLCKDPPNGSYSDAWLYSVIITTSFNTGLGTSIIIRRLLFHRAKKFPGPFFAKITAFNAVILSSKKLQYHLELQDFHKAYGDFVRIGESPGQIHYLVVG